MSGLRTISPLPDGATIAASALVEADLDRIARLNLRFRAMVTPDPEGARRMAAVAADGPLAGMTLTVKDNIDTAGLRTACGSRLFADHVPTEDATVVGRLRRAGAILLGKASMMELAFGLRTTDAIGGQCRNPWNPDHVPGGSSGGSAASVALDFGTASLGTDTGGSVRMPSAFCGVTGLRPTHGRVSNKGVLPVSETFDTVGPIARRVQDVAAVYQVIAGHDPADPHSVDRPVEAWDGSNDVAGLRVGVPETFYFDAIDTEVAAALARVVAALRKSGAAIVPVALPGAETAHAHATRIILSDACALHERALDQRRGDISDQVYERMIKGRDVTGVNYAQSLRFRERWRQMLAGLFTRVDVLLMPTTPGPAARIEDGAHLEDATRHATRFTYGGGLAGTPGLSLPCGFTASGLPIGALFEAPWWQETRLFRIGAWWQAQTDWHLRHAPVLDFDKQPQHQGVRK
ncbi:amidase [Tabrizicola sp. BL-A-41-H6]|uniref:amidase n=1 Tax=Tabrizicola sp. BL-A-41-H6 TaxID=3421107 RepID=UPI003D665426